MMSTCDSETSNTLARADCKKILSASDRVSAVATQLLRARVVMQYPGKKVAAVCERVKTATGACRTCH